VEERFLLVFSPLGKPMESACTEDCDHHDGANSIVRSGFESMLLDATPMMFGLVFLFLWAMIGEFAIVQP
jgi:hypothetical protein